jgi:AcrR family transcriptional regulator
MPGTTIRRTQQERSQTTISQLLDAARERFGTGGYADTSLDDIANHAGVSKGALYHHFPDGKPELFRAVFEREQRLLADAVVTASRRRRDSWEAFFDGCRAFLELSVDPKVQRITLFDAPAVLGWEQMRELEAPHSFTVLRAGLKAAVDDGRLAGRDPTILAHLVLGAMCEGVAVVASSANPHATIRKLLAELRALLVG